MGWQRAEMDGFVVGRRGSEGKREGWCWCFVVAMDEVRF